MLLCAAAMVPAATAAGHGVNVFAEAAGARVVGLVYFAGGGKAVDVEVELVDGEGATVAAARTDAAGEFVLTAAKAGTYRVVADLGDGHRAECGVKVVSTDDMPSEAATELRERVQSRADRDGSGDWVDGVLKVVAGVMCIMGVFVLVRFFKRSRLHSTGEEE